MTRVGVVVNPTAGHGRAAATGRQVLDLLAAAGCQVVDLTGDDAQHALARARSALEGLAALVVVGGDGMAHLGVNAIAGTGVGLGIVPAGSGNDLARALRLPIRDTREAVDLIVSRLSRGPRYIDAIASTSPGAPSRVPRWTACVLSAGIDAAVNARANSYRWPAGGGRYVRGVLAELSTFRPYRYRLTIDGHSTVQDATLVALANAPSFGGGMRIAPNARFDDGLMDVVIGDGLRRGQILRLFPSLYAGRHLSHPAVHVHRATQVVIEPAGRPAPPPAFGDGEYLAPLPISAILRPGAVPLLALPQQPDAEGSATRH